MLELEDVEVVYARKGQAPLRSVAGASLVVERGQIVCLVGESGCGKSSLARAAVGLMAPSAGAVRFDGRALNPLTRRGRSPADTRLQLVFQDPYSSLNPRRSVGSQLADGMEMVDRIPRDRRARRVAELLAQVGLDPDAAGRFPHQFSGGQRQRLAIARALAVEPSVIILDEPLSSLDASAQAQVANLLVALSRQLDIGMLLISHDLGIVRQIADAIAVMYLGLIVETGRTGAVWSKPRHPYTKALIDAVPRADGSGTLPLPLDGEVPDPGRPPAGCRFHPRCPHAMDRCRVERPEPVELAPGRTAACWLHAPGAGAGG